MTERDMMHGIDWDGRENLSGWYASEKLDGCRAYWDGEQFWTRGGNTVAAPKAILEAMPSVPLDGEFWAGRGRLQEARLAVQHGRFMPSVRFVVFDAPQAPGDWLERMAYARTLGVECVEGWTVRSHRHLCHELARIKESGGEGLMLQAPGSGYVAGRRKRLVKVKAQIF